MQQQNILYYVVSEGKKDPQIVYGDHEMHKIAPLFDQPRIKKFMDEASALKYYKALVELEGKSDLWKNRQISRPVDFKKPKVDTSGEVFLESKKFNIYAENGVPKWMQDQNKMNSYSGQIIEEDNSKRTLYEERGDMEFIPERHGMTTSNYMNYGYGNQ